MLNEDDISYVPKYVQIQNYILQKIKDGVLSEGDRIPSEAELSKQFDVSRITVSTAIKELANARVVERIRGKGTYVLSSEGNTDKKSMAFASEIKIAPFEQSVYRPHKLIEHGIIPAGPALCEKLNLAQGSYVIKSCAVSVWRASRTNWTTTTSLFPYAAITPLTARRLRRFSCMNISGNISMKSPPISRYM